MFNNKQSMLNNAVRNNDFQTQTGTEDERRALMTQGNHNSIRQTSNTLSELNKALPRGALH